MDTGELKAFWLLEGWVIFQRNFPVNLLIYVFTNVLSCNRLLTKMSLLIIKGWQSMKWKGLGSYNLIRVASVFRNYIIELLKLLRFKKKYFYMNESKTWTDKFMVWVSYCRFVMLTNDTLFSRGNSLKIFRVKRCKATYRAFWWRDSASCYFCVGIHPYVSRSRTVSSPWWASTPSASLRWEYTERLWRS